MTGLSTAREAEMPTLRSERHYIGATYRPEPGPSRCIVCGDSPFAEGRPVSDLFGSSFTDFGLMQGDGEVACQGCSAMLGGRPGGTPMPLRLGHFAVLGEDLARPTSVQLWALLYDPPEDLHAIGWTATRQRHASLRCGPCSPGLLMVGSEQGTIPWDVEQCRPLLDAVHALRAQASQDVILTGQYPPHVIATLGPLWEPNEEVVRRWRPSMQLQMAVAVTPRPEPKETEPMPMTESQTRAARIVADLASASAARKANALDFWGGLLARRLTVSASRQDLVQAVGDLMQRIQVSPLLVSDTVDALRWMPEDEAAATLREMRDRPLLIVALARQMAKEDQELRQLAKEA
jgi:hypothetical protein